MILADQRAANDDSGRRAVNGIPIPAGAAISVDQVTMEEILQAAGASGKKGKKVTQKNY